MIGAPNYLYRNEALTYTDDRGLDLYVEDWSPATPCNHAHLKACLNACLSTQFSH